MILETVPDDPKRCASAEGGVEKKLTEPAVMISLAMYALEHSKGRGFVRICPDGEHGKQFDIRSCLEMREFKKIKSIGSTCYGGLYERGQEQIEVNPKSGQGDVVGKIDGQEFFAECKGGVINSNHAGQLSRLRKGLYEMVGQLMAIPLQSQTRFIAACPDTPETEKLSLRLFPRCKAAGIEIALVCSDGKVRFICAS